MNNEPLFWAWWGWEPICFYRSGGTIIGAKEISPENLEKWYDSIHHEKAVASVSKIGVNCAITHFYKGFGLEYEKPEMQRTAELVRHCRKYKIKVIGYIQYGSIFHETFFREVPDAADWIQVDRQGQPLLWWGAAYRYLPCVNHPQFTAYLKKCMKYGLEEIGLDGLHFDNFYSRPCYCETCRQKFSEYLNENCAGKLDVLGVESADAVNIPEESALLSASPLVTAWREFRKQAMNALMRELYSYARAIKKNVLLLANPSAIRGLQDQGSRRSTDIWQIGRQADLLWAESGNFPGIRNNCLIHQVNFFKTAETIGYRTLSTTWKRGIEGSGLPDSPEDISLNMAESAAFGAEPGTNWLLRPTNSGSLIADAKPRLVAELSKYFRFIRENPDIFVGSQACSDTALYLSYGARRADYRHTYGAFMTAQQALLQNHVQFDLLFSEQAEKLANYSRVIIVDAEDLDAVEINALRAYAEAGGKLLLGGVCDVRLSKLNNFNIRHCPLSGNWAEYADGEYIAYMHLPPDAGCLIDCLHEFTGQPERVAVSAPEEVLSEFRRSRNGAAIIHLVNYRNTVAVSDVTVSIDASRLPVSNEAELLNPDTEGKTMLEGISVNNIISFKAPAFKTYSILQFRENA